MANGVDTRLLVVGDLHGADKALEQLLARIDLQDSDQFVFLGDYVNGWPDAANLIDRLICLSKTYNCTFLKGNHDLWWGDWLESGIVGQGWLDNKGETTLSSYPVVNEQVKKEHLLFYRSLKNYYTDDMGRLFVHGGFTAMGGPTKEPSEHVFFNDRTLIEVAMSTKRDIDPESPMYPKRLALFSEIYIGHTPTINYSSTHPIHAVNLWAMDTGASKGGRVSMLDVVTKRTWQSDKVADLYS